MKKTLILIASLALLFSLSSFGQGLFAAEDVWRIGTIYPLSGPNSKNGVFVMKRTYFIFGVNFDCL